MARFFIGRPVFAMVIAIIIVVLGLVAIRSLPIASYPQVVPPQVQVTATLPSTLPLFACAQSL